MSLPATTSYGAYGLRFDADDGSLPRDYLTQCPENWTQWSFTTHVSPVDELLDRTSYPEFLGEESARLFFDSSARIELSRPLANTELFTDHVPSDDELAHPYLGYTAAVVGWWQGRFAMHGSAASSGGRALGFLGSREQGKSTTLAHLLSRGWAAIADDMLVIDGRNVLAGPRCLDLRESTAKEWGLGDDIGVVGTRRRWRMRTGLVAPSSPLTAFVELHWGPTISISALPVEERLKAVFSHRTVDARPRRGDALLGLLGVPFLRVARPRNLGMVAPMIGEILEFLDSLESH